MWRLSGIFLCKGKINFPTRLHTNAERNYAAKTGSKEYLFVLIIFILVIEIVSIFFIL